MKELEKILNELIEKGYGKDKGYEKCEIYKNGDICFGKMEEMFYGEPKVLSIKDTFSLNDLCSIDSGFWQFVCGNELVNGDEFYLEDVGHYGDEEYRLMLSSIQPDKAKFICDNIKL